jgi:hypothetical protein
VYSVFVVIISLDLVLVLNKWYQCKVAREVVGGPRGPIVIIVEVIQCKVD